MFPITNSRYLPALRHAAHPAFAYKDAGAYVANDYVWNMVGPPPPAFWTALVDVGAFYGIQAPAVGSGQEQAFALSVLQSLTACGVLPTDVTSAVNANVDDPHAVALALYNIAQARCPELVTGARPSVAMGGAAGLPWGWIAVGVGGVAAAGVTTYLILRKKRRR
jgi:hypothetical protein